MELVRGGEASSSSTSRMFSAWSNKLREHGRRRGRRSLPTSACSDCYFASRDDAGHCSLWSLKGDKAVESADGVPTEDSLLSVFSDEVSSVGSGSWTEERRSSISRPDTFTLEGKDGEDGGGCTVSMSVNGWTMEVLPTASVSAANCSCAAKIYIGTFFVLTHTLYAFNRREGGRWQTVVCCGLRDGPLAILDLIRT